MPGGNTAPHGSASSCPASPRPGETARRVRRLDLKGNVDMKLSAPKVITWWIATALGALGLLGHFAIVSALGAYAFWLVTAGLVVLVLATLLNDL